MSDNTPNEVNKEIWKAIPGYPRYEVSNLGNVRSWCDFKGGVAPEPRPVKPLVSTDRRLRFCAILHGEKHYVPIHVAVLTAFVGPRPEGLVCCHNDGNCQHNRRDNLRWDTPEANLEDQRKHGQFHKNNARLTPEQVVEIRTRYAAGESSYDLGPEFGITRGYVTDLTRGKSWADTGGPRTTGRNRGFYIARGISRRQVRHTRPSQK